jgi:choline dehydrogenase
MGTDAFSVTAPDGRVHGVDGLRVVDSSLMPQATAGDLNAPTLVLAERMADLIRDRHLPEATGAALLADEHWASRQRGPVISRDYAADRASLAAALLANARGEGLPKELEVR